MIRELRLLDLGVIADATIELGEGLTAITGETGAGKTMLLTGLGLLLGGRADSSAVRAGARQAAVEGRLVVHGEALRIAEDAGAMLDDGELVVVRTVAAEGRSRAHLGGRSVPVGVLAEMGSELVAVHGQSDQIRLRAPAEQRAALDAYAGPAQQEALAALAAAHRRRRELAAELERWDAETSSRADELDRLERALERIDALEPRLGEIDALREETERLGNVELLLGAAASARAALDGDDEGGVPGALTALEAARRALESGAVHDSRLGAWAERLTEAIHVVNDVVTETGSYAASLEADPARLEALHERRAALTDLVRGLGAEAAADDPDPLAGVLAFAERARARVGELTAPGGGREAIEERLAQAVADEQAAAAEVTENRRRAAEGLSAQVDAELEGLSMRGAHLHVELTPRAETGPHGAEDVELQLSPHPDVPPRPIARGASGGELSRIMLALEVALADRRAADGALPVFVFDEVDAGIGGRAATEVGRRLAELARHTQVVVVTHLAQVAAFADTHLVVSRSSDDDGVTTTVHAVTGEDRERELARMLSGEDSETALRHAAELLERPERADVRR
ncbi:MAG TPA: DNA repair protein RecN [Actinotalea caeni]|uniref:DNA repair protein RecN n=1 Tax=Actinotalea caeni TaxID=1348467 RepID=UPI002B4ADF9B|nr:DNA repair protein RecN [Actinotalea caeni]HLV55935.1 DNA repair protein RecN [Actinotalea caeni]